MKGYYVSCGYMGWIGGKYQLFSTEEEYKKAFDEYSIFLFNSIFDDDDLIED